MRYIYRERNSNDDIIVNSNMSLSFLYNTLLGRLILKLFVNKPFSLLVGKYMNSSLSKSRIKKFINKNSIKTTDYEQKEYKSFNDYFTRKIVESKRPITNNKDILISPCDSNLSIYKINNDLTLLIKGAYYSIDTLVNKELLKNYIDGYALVFRLSEDNYHRYCYIDSGYQDENLHINGKFHTVQPISLNHYNFYKTNTREYTILHTNNFDDVIEVEIGAMCIGKITNLHEYYKFIKGEEKGYFEFGGSTIVLLIKKEQVLIDEDIEYNSNEGIETFVKYGERIGRKQKNSYLK